MSRNTTATILLEHIKFNYLLANQSAPNSKNIAIIKANAYGHGLTAVAHYLKDDAAGFGVAIFDEAMLLRNNAITNEILILQGVNSKDELLIASENNLWITIHNVKQLQLLLTTPLNQSIKVSIKLDSGMHRLGLNKHDFIQAINSLCECSWVKNKMVLCSHFSSASNLTCQESKKQMATFFEVVNKVKQLNKNKEFELSLANSPALLGLPESLLDWNRPGIMLYGTTVFDTPHPLEQPLKPAMIFEAKIIGLRDIKVNDSVGYNQNWIAERSSKIATVSVGYADGYPRHAKNGTPVYLNHQVASLVGRVSMDLISIDVTDIIDVEIGDIVELWGDNIPVSLVAKHADTIAYELLTGVSNRVKRIYR